MFFVCFICCPGGGKAGVLERSRHSRKNGLDPDGLEWRDEPDTKVVWSSHHQGVIDAASRAAAAARGVGHVVRVEVLGVAVGHRRTVAKVAKGARSRAVAAIRRARDIEVLVRIGR
jgi:hypothetical protein